MKWAMTIIMALTFILGCKHSTLPVAHQSQWKPRVFEKESDNPQLWLATVNALNKAGVSYKVIRIKEMQWSAQPYYLAILEGTNGITLQCTVGGRIGEPFSYVTIDLKQKETPQPPPGN